MPVYGYRCTNGHHFEIQQRITEPPLTVCPQCGAPVTRVFYPVGIIFKGGGFYKTDSRGASSDGSMIPADAAPKTDTKTESETKAKTTPDAGSSKSAPPPPAKTDQKTSTEEGAA